MVGTQRNQAGRDLGREVADGPGFGLALLWAFRAVYAAAALLSISVGGLVTASLFIAQRAPRGMEFLGVSLAVSGVFLGMGLLLLGIRRRTSSVVASLNGPGGEQARALVRHLRWLTAYLLLGGLLLAGLLGVLTFAILARIDQGFAVFG